MIYIKDIVKRVVTGIVLGLCFWLSFIYLPPEYFSLVLLGILIQIIIFEWQNLFPITKAWFWIVMPFYPILPFALFILMNQNPQYHDLLLILFILVSSFDTGSYLVGSMIGKHKIWPAISPGKSWEGFVGGYCFATISLTLLLWEQDKLQPWYFMIGFTLIICALALFGDLFESWLKRRAHIKDTGTILPGHGGFLDRFDGILFAVVFFYCLKDYLDKLFG